MATTTIAMMTESIKNRYYDELFLTVSEKNLVHTQLGQLNRQVPGGENAYAIYWTRFKPLAVITSGATEGAATDTVNLSAVNVTGTVTQYDNAVAISDVLAATSMGDIMKEAIRELGYNAGLTIDTKVRDTIVPGGIPQMAALTGSQAVTRWSSIPRTAVLSIKEIRRATMSLRKMDAQAPDSKVSMSQGQSVSTNPGAGMGGYWASVISPETVYDLQGDTATGAWVDSNRYAGSDKLFSGEVGKLYGVRFMETSNAKVHAEKNGAVTSRSAIVASGVIHETLIVGANYFGITKLQQLQTFIKPFGQAIGGDITNKVAGAGWKTSFGTKVLYSGYGVSVFSSVGANSL